MAAFGGTAGNCVLAKPPSVKRVRRERRDLARRRAEGRLEAAFQRVRELEEELVQERRLWCDDDDELFERLRHDVAPLLRAALAGESVSTRDRQLHNVASHVFDVPMGGMAHMSGAELNAVQRAGRAASCPAVAAVQRGGAGGPEAGSDRSHGGRVGVGEAGKGRSRWTRTRPRRQ